MAKKLAVLLTPGASATKDHAGLVALDSGLTAAGHVVRRIDFTGKGKRESVLTEFIAEQAADLANETRRRVIVGGRSFGGRMCSMAVASGLDVAGLLLLSYPLHPPGKPDALRTDHFADITVPTAFVSGSRDAFGTPDEFAKAVALIPGTVTTEWIEGGNHGMRGKDSEVLDATLRWLTGLRL